MDLGLMPICLWVHKPLSLNKLEGGLQNSTCPDQLRSGKRSPPNRCCQNLSPQEVSQLPHTSLESCSRSASESGSVFFQITASTLELRLCEILSTLEEGSLFSTALRLSCRQAWQIFRARCYGILSS